MAVMFNGYDLTEYMDIGKINRDILPPREVKTFNIPNKAGAYFLSVNHDVRVYEVPYRISGTSYEDLQDKINVIAEILDTDEPKELIFAREPEMTFFAICVNETPTTNNVSFAKGTLQFLMVDPYKYGASYNLDLGTAEGLKQLTNNANESFAPVWTIDFSSDATFFSIISADGFVMVGNPKAVDQISVPLKEIILYDNMTDLSRWTSSGVVADYGKVSGSFAVDAGHQFKPSSFGDSNLYPYDFHGPALRQSLSTPLQDFTIELSISLFSTTTATGRIEMLLIDDTGQTLGKMVLWDRFDQNELTTGHIYAGTQTDQREIIRSMGIPNIRSWNNFYGKLILKRVGQRWNAQIVQTEADGTFKYSTWLHKQLILPDGVHDNPLATIQIHASKYGTGDYASMAIRDIQIHRINTVTEIEVPTLFHAGDRLVIDHEKGAVFLNGEYIQNHLDSGSKFFKVLPGINDFELKTSDPANVSVSVAYRERWK
jgi:predicted phage tail component-like protein